MVPITIGVPVYNGADMLDESLACLARQTFRDFEVLIFDNASTDATGAIARSWVERDSRFRYFRNATNIGAVLNFSAPLEAATSPWFLWRADDDLSGDNYLECLYKAATASPGCRLAAAEVVSHDLDGGRRKVASPPRLTDPASLSSRLRMLLGVHPSWFYGLWETETIQKINADLIAHYPFAYASDHLALYGPIIDGAVRAAPGTRFIQRIRRTATTPRRQTRAPFALMAEARGRFRDQLRRMRAERRLGAVLTLALVVVEPLYLQRTVFRWQKMLRTWLRERLGMASRGMGKGYYFDRIDRDVAEGVATRQNQDEADAKR